MTGRAPSPILTSNGPRHRLVALVASCGLALAACGTTAGDGAASRTTTTVPPPTTEAPVEDTTPPPVPLQGDDEADCPQTAAIEDLLGESVERYMAFGGNFSGDLGYSSQGCSYETSDGSRKVTVSRLTTDAPLDGRLFDALDDAAAIEADRSGFSPLDDPDLGDDAYLDGRRVVVRSGGAMVFVSYQPATDAELGEENPAIALAADVVGAGVDPDRAPDCDALADLVATRLGVAVDAIESGGFIGLDDVDLTTRGCAMSLEDGTDIDVDVAADDQWDAWVAAKQGSLFTSGYEPLELDGRLAFDTGDRLVLDDGTDGPDDSPYEVATDGDALDGDEGAVLRIEVAELLLAG